MQILRHLLSEDDDDHDDDHDDEDHHDEIEYHTSDIWLGILFVFAAGAMIAFGGALSFIIPTKYKQILPISLAFSAGVIIYLAFIEIWPETEHSFESSSDEEYIVHIYTSLTFFSGILIGGLLDKAVHLLGYEHDHHHMHHGPNQNGHQKEKQNQGGHELVNNQSSIGLNNAGSANDDNVDSGDNGENIDETVDSGDNGDNNINIENNNENSGENSVTITKEEEKELIRISLVTAIAISLHNFPEGLATFIGTIADPAIGASIAIAVAIHNIPIGISISTPVYYVTRSKWKAIGISALAGITQPIGGLIGLIVIETGLSDAGFGIMFGITGGLMIYTCFRELLPAARFRDPTDKYTSWLVFVGFIVLDISLILFDISGGHAH